MQFDVADFVPQKLKVTLTPETPVVHTGEDIKIKVESRFLYGAPASGLSGEGTAKIVRDYHPYPEFDQYSFGRADDSWSDVDVQMSVPETDAAGVTEATGSGRRSRRYHAHRSRPTPVTISVHEPGGRTTDKAGRCPGPPSATS